MKKYIIIMFLSFMTLVSCLKDESKEFKDNFDGYTIDSIQRTYEKVIGDRFRVEPVVKINHIKDESSLEYLWIMYYKSTNVADTVSREKNIDIFISAKYGETISCQFQVIDKINDIRYRKNILISTSSVYKKGWVILSEKDNKGYLSFISDVNETVTTDLYGKEFGEPMPKGRYLDYYSGSSERAIGVVLAENPEKTFFLEGKGLSYTCSLASLFKTMDYVQGPFAPMNMSLDLTVGGNSIIYVLANKKIYAKPGSLTLKGNVFGTFVDGDYEVGEHYGVMGPLAESFVTYDYKNKRYIYVTQDDVTTIKTYSTPISEGNPFNINNTDVTPLWMGCANPKIYADSYFTAVVKNNQTQKYQVQQFLIKRVKVDGIYGYHLQRINLYNLPNDIYNPNCQICTSNNIMYVANGKTIYRLNLEIFGTMDAIKTMDEEITCMEYYTEEAIAVATKATTGDLQGNLSIVSTQTDNLGEIIETYTGVGGVIIDMKYKRE